MNITIHRGTKEIGGTCVEIKADNGKRLWVDLGQPLETKNPDTSYAHTQHPDALLISHPHTDHYGLMESVGIETPIYIGKVSLDLINASRIFREYTPIEGNFQPITAWKEFTVAQTFHIKPFLVDHSTPEAFAFLIEADEKKVFYSGDFRGTGRKKILHDRLVENPPKHIDLLLIEGTMMERNNQAYPTEESVEEGIYTIIREQKNVTFVVSSAQNIDRFVSVLRACKRAGKQVVIDIYTAWVLDMVKKVSKRLPVIEREEIRVFKHPAQWEKINADEFSNFRQRIERNIIENDVFNNPSTYVYFLRSPNIKLIDKLRKFGKINIIYSQWKGYLEESHKIYSTEIVNRLKVDKDIHFDIIHTSGHAALQELKGLANAIGTQKIVPIHTNNPDKFLAEFQAAGFEKVDIWNDGKEYNVS
jgi:ribonuclease J